MIDIPPVGINLLNNAASHVAEIEQDSNEFDSFMTVIDTCRGLVGRTALRAGLQKTAKSGPDLVQRERDVVRAVTEVSEIVEMME